MGHEQSKERRAKEEERTDAAEGRRFDHLDFSGEPHQHDSAMRPAPMRTGYAGQNEGCLRRQSLDDPHDVGFSQQTYGNTATLRSHRPVDTVQLKLRTTPSADPQEQEADRAAEAVVQGSPETSRPFPTPAPLSPVAPRMQRLETEESGTTVAAPVAPSPTTAPTAAETTTAAIPPTPGLIVEDAAPELSPGQMRKSEFLAQLRAAVSRTADEALAGTIWSAVGCPWIDHWFGYYSARDSGSIERAIHHYVPETSGIITAADYIPLICGRVRRGIAEWATTSEAAGAPAGVLGRVQEGAASLFSGVASAASTLVSGAGGVLAQIGGVFFKGRRGVVSESANPQALRAQLDAGRPLESGVKSRMESAFGQDFSSVRIHADAGAAQLSDGLEARAFTIGRDVAFGAGEYQPGTLIGDALIAHELAHVVQQGGGGDVSQPLQKGDAERGTLEEEADVSAVGAVVSLWGGTRAGSAGIGGSAMPHLRSGLRLQRCSTERRPEEAFIPMSADESAALARIRQDIRAAEGLLQDESVSDEDRERIRAAIESARGALSHYSELRSAGETRAYIMAPIGVASGAILADDATGVGVGDDPLLILCALAAIATYIATSAPATREALTEAWASVGRSVSDLSTVISTVFMAQAVGNQVRGLMGILIVHLARILGETVGGQPPDHQEDPERDRPHWWTEIKNLIRQIRDKGLSDRQLLRELRRRFTEEQLRQVRDAIRRAAERMGEDPPDFPPAVAP